MGSAAISQFPCPLVGCRFCSLRHILAHVPSSESYIRGRVGKFTIYQFLASAAATIVATLRTSELLHNPRVQAVDARQDLCAEEQDGQEPNGKLRDQLGAF
jgi:hypothetical protein